MLYLFFLIQQLSLADFNHFRDLPENIPAMLTVGTKVIGMYNYVHMFMMKLYM